MPAPITAFLPYSGHGRTARLAAQLEATGLVRRTHLLAPEGVAHLPGCGHVTVEHPHGSRTVQVVAELTATPAALVLLADVAVELGPFSLERLLAVREATGAGLVYADHAVSTDGRRAAHPAIDYQEGSLRDDFDFGPLVLVDAAALKAAARELRHDSFAFAGLYALRL
ncbi:MAG: glycosyltransferase family 2 protein, partial [Gemmatimonadota bacterium]